LTKLIGLIFIEKTIQLNSDHFCFFQKFNKRILRNKFKVAGNDEKCFQFKGGTMSNG